MDSLAAPRAVIFPRWGWPPMVVVAALIGFLLPMVHRPLLLDGDTYWHLAAGQWMLDHATVPHTDPFSATMPGTPWVAHEWLSEVLMTLAYQGAGWSGLQLLCSATLALTLAMIARYLTRWLDQPAALVSAVVACFAIVPSLLARPHLIALVPLVAWCVALLRARELERVPAWPLLPLMTLWANLHGSFVLGLALAGVLALEAVAAAPGRRLPEAARWAVFLAAATAATMLTPYGWHGLLYPLQLMRLDLIAYIAEWQPPNFNHPQPLTLALLVLLYVALTRPVTVPLSRLFIVLALLTMALKHSRHQVVAGVVGTLVLAAPLGQALGCQVAGGARMAARRWGAVALALAGLAVALRLAMPVARTDDHATPATALRHVPAALLSQPVFNSYEFGGYLIHRHVRPFVDGRSDMYGDAFMRDYMAPFAPDRAAFERLAARYGVRWALVAADSTPMLYLLDTLPGWRRLYGDQVATVYVRVD
ncbi:hypothetical protein H3H37_23060 [Duganella sp. LX20W]|uniref:Glycosyltransferase RgtA/B/C/D-like domain-containing protein n=1 Tax=Rugamonas brunnea TaxID=2758569 RepID=A0A7W2IDZ7_9BURK|nr:hypothetical protein [Rugamonas brunnea]MBA5639944.1 hypothetical protein [Rugamonas brunnea]